MRSLAVGLAIGEPQCAMLREIVVIVAILKNAILKNNGNMTSNSIKNSTKSNNRQQKCRGHAEQRRIKQPRRELALTSPRGRGGRRHCRRRKRAAMPELYNVHGTRASVSQGIHSRTKRTSIIPDRLHQSIHARTLITSMAPEHPFLRASM